MTLFFKTKSLICAMGLSYLALTAGTAGAVQSVDAALPDYQKATGISGNLSSVGSDTLANLMTLWAEEFNRAYPNVNIQIQAAGSSTAPPALTEGTANLGPMSREMKEDELEAFEDKYGYKPTAIPVAIDALAVLVNKDNPIKGLAIEQVDAIFSSTHKCGYEKDIENWGDVGVAAWASKTIQLYGRNSVSGTYGYFKEHALCKGDFKSNVNEQPGSASVVQSVTSSANGIGYSGMGYTTSGVKMVPLAKKAGQPFVEATPENAINGSYPLTRYLFVYVNKKPNEPLPPLENEFIKMVLSKTGQNVVIKDGYIPLPAKIVSKIVASLK
ncbi:PstS family phosphate ABC transporter substrate-binding protein [Methylovulum psychrotolerans]|jgi:phosphate transport system substrate-binding protein|uniref:Phosphate-binding protein n=1 Tax=Methylovulum psychrotolerans TaxID=1704499 RepID=A0A1Z4BTW9_9GAMM|nr:phosphate ABC transporter substrate-binding protein PstS family protein [Methylovulum psychrotolerans]ASF44680.1 phosphate-binding protein [Methylovulum psychrotolerans]MBT9098799.1 phosphate ABC transporter substrate-binding protein PstS family protein [Methylovulum psychrotolerans]POZ52621.1 phosphate-binding protein [Methylovulum psychrotolerans]